MKSGVLWRQASKKSFRYTDVLSQRFFLAFLAIHHFRFVLDGKKGEKPMENNLEKQEAITQIKKLTEPIFKEYGVEKAYVFGSYARGDYNENSDIDIIIVAKNIRSLLIIGAILEALKRVLKREVDLIEEECFEEDNMEEWEQEFYNNIKKERVIIYG